MITKTELKKAKKEIGLLDRDDIAKITGWSQRTVRKLMNEPEFPIIQKGRKKQVLLQDLRDYLSYKRTTKPQTR